MHIPFLPRATPELNAMDDLFRFVKDVHCLIAKLFRLRIQQMPHLVIFLRYHRSNAYAKLVFCRTTCGCSPNLL
jgi:hypothetical protein